MIKVGITDNSKYQKYADWVLDSVLNVEVIKLSYKENNYIDLEQCDAVLLTGGDEDIHPKFYGKPEYLELLNPDEIIIERDLFELELVSRIFDKKLPILGICRGMQLINVYQGGTLIPDLLTYGKNDHAKYNGIDKEHSVNIPVNSVVLKEFVGQEAGIVNSAHHQAVDVVGEGLQINAWSEDKVIEGLEWKDSSKLPFLLLVQWHPERMNNLASPFSRNIRDNFLKRIKV